MSDNTGLVIVIVPNHNSGCYLRETVESVLNQTYPHWELIIIDDHSTDDSLAIMQEYCRKDERIRSIVLENNSGTPSVPRNIGIEQARGEYIAFLDADDLWHPQKLELQVDFLIEQGADFCFTNVLPFKDAGEVRKLQEVSLKDQPLSYRTLNHARLLLKNVIKSGSSVLVRSETVGETRFNEDVKYRAVEDYLFWLTLHQHEIEKSYWLQHYLVFYREAKTSISRSKVFMVGQHYRMYANYSINGRPLGWRKYLYMLTYIVYSIILIARYRMIKRRVGVD